MSQAESKLFLTPEELSEMTQVSKKRPLQEEWLKKNRIPYTLGAKGRINVLRTFVERAHGIKDAAVTRPNEETEPNMDAFKRRPR